MIFSKKIRLETFCWANNANKKFNGDWLEECQNGELAFMVPRKWLKNFVKEEFESDLKAFLDEYTYDDAYTIFEKALDTGIVSNIKVTGCNHCGSEQ